jgi:hypothetical protein
MEILPVDVVLMHAGRPKLIAAFRELCEQSFVILGYPTLLCGFCGKSSVSTGENRHITWIYNHTQHSEL